MFFLRTAVRAGFLKTACLIAKSNTSLTPEFLIAEHSMYLNASSSEANFLASSTDTLSPDSSLKSDLVPTKTNGAFGTW